MRPRARRGGGICGDESPCCVLLDLLRPDPEEPAFAEASAGRLDMSAIAQRAKAEGRGRPLISAAILRGAALRAAPQDEGGASYSAAACCAPCGRRSRKCGRISSAIAAMLARVMSSGNVPNWVLVSDVLKPARS